MTMLNARYYGLEPWPHHDELTDKGEREMEAGDIYPTRWSVEARTTRPTDNTHCTVTVQASDDFDAAMAARHWLHEVYGHTDWAIDSVNMLIGPKANMAPDLHEHPFVKL